MYAETIVGWAYDAGIHCDDCARQKFGDALDDETAEDSEGNAPTPYFAYQETEHDDHCEDCGELVQSGYCEGCTDCTDYHGNAFIRAYIECALWSSTDNSRDDGGDPLDRNYDESDIAFPTLKRMIEDCRSFKSTERGVLEASGLSDEQAGHDFWLTRNGHGAGFWDRGLGHNGEVLTRAAEAWGVFDLYIGDDGKVHGS